MRTGNAIIVLGSILVAAGVLGGDALPWFRLVHSGVVLPGMAFNLGYAFLATAVLSAVFALTGFITRDRVYAIVPTMGALVVFIGAMSYIFDIHAILGLPSDEVARAGAGLLWSMGGAGVMVLGALVIFASDAGWEFARPVVRLSVEMHGNIIDERILNEQRVLIVGGKPKPSFFETGLFQFLFAALTLVVPALVFGPMIAEYAGQRRRRKFLHIPPGKFPDGAKLFVVHPRKGVARLGLVEGLEGRVSIQGRVMTPDEAMREFTPVTAGVNYITLQDGDWGEIRFDRNVALYFHFAPLAVAARPRKGVFAFDRNVAASTAVSALAQVALLLFALFAWKEEPIRRSANDIRRLLKVDVETTVEEEPETLDLEEDQEDDSTAKAAEGEEGKFGDPDLPPEKESKVPNRDGQMVKKIDPKKVGLNAFLSNTHSSAISSILSSDTSAFSSKIAVAMAGSGSEFELGHGSGGLGFKGTGTGGGGTGGFGRIHGMGKIDTGGGLGRGVSGGLGKKRKKRVVKFRIGSAQTQGFCKKSDIVRIVKMRAGAIRACYERRLQLHPKLKGKLTVRWTIGLDGRVKQVTVMKSTLSDRAVGQCVLRIIRHLRFRKPEGGICVIKWPFVFTQG